MWTAETKRGSFEAETLEKLAKQIADKYYDTIKPVIKKLFYTLNDFEVEVTYWGIIDFQNEIEEWGEAYLERYQHEMDYQQECRSLIYGRI